jgi:ketosteroid isomerase-like protein
MTPEAALERANAQFYAALSLADLGAMQRVWWASENAVCTHPGWQAIYGWSAIRESWQNIFAQQGPLHVWATEVQVRVYGQTAEVYCLENIDSGQLPNTGILQTQATNIFRLVKNDWKLLEHHAFVRRTNQIQQLERFSRN